MLPVAPKIAIRFMDRNMVQEGSFFKPLELKQSVHFFDALQRGIELCNGSLVAHERGRKPSIRCIAMDNPKVWVLLDMLIDGHVFPARYDSLPAKTVRTEMISFA